MTASWALAVCLRNSLRRPKKRQLIGLGHQIDAIKTHVTKCLRHELGIIDGVLEAVLLLIRGVSNHQGRRGGFAGRLHQRIRNSERPELRTGQKLAFENRPFVFSGRKLSDVCYGVSWVSQ